MNFSQLQSFITVVQRHSFSEAAKQLHFSQSTITMHVNELEKELGQQLLVRSTRDFKLTKAGMSCYSFAVAVVSRKNALLSEYNKDFQPKKILRIVASTIPSHCYLPGILGEYHKLHSEVFLKIIPSDSRSITENMVEHQAHIAFCGYEKKNKEYIYTQVEEDQLVVITASNKNYNIHDDNGVFPDQLLLTEPMVCRAPTSGTRTSFERYLVERKIYEKPNIICEMPDTDAIINAVSVGLGIAVISSLEVRQVIDKGQINMFYLEDFPRRALYMVKKKHDTLLAYEQEFYDYVMKQVSQDEKII